MTRYMDRRNIKKYTYEGRSHTLGEWSEKTGIEYQTLRERLIRGWTLEEALTRPVSHGSHGMSLTFNGETLKISEWAKRIGMRANTLRSRLAAGMPVEKVLCSGALPHPLKSQAIGMLPHAVEVPAADLQARIEARTLNAEATLDRPSEVMPAPAPATTRTPRMAVTLCQTGMSGADAVSLLLWAQGRGIALTLSVEAA